jgi:opacity protein-like surface antigen
MYKKIILASAALLSTVGVAIAKPAPYIGTSLGVNVNSSTNASANTAGVFRGVPLKVFAGFGGVLTESFYLAGEVTGTLATAVINNKNDMKTSYGYSVSVLPGLMLSDNTLAYARGGFVRSRFTNVNKMNTGGQLGVGMQTAVTQHVDLRGEYDYTSYANVGGIKSPSTDEYTVGVVYKFD